ncbi:unnamed protein product, partial [Mycena citricolor]
ETRPPRCDRHVTIPRRVIARYPVHGFPADRILLGGGTTTCALPRKTLDQPWATSLPGYPPHNGREIRAQFLEGMWLYKRSGEWGVQVLSRKCCIDRAQGEKAVR